jgi:hypothetical protein
VTTKLKSSARRFATELSGLESDTCLITAASPVRKPCSIDEATTEVVEDLDQLGRVVEEWRIDGWDTAGILHAPIAHLCAAVSQRSRRLDLEVRAIEGIVGAGPDTLASY